MSEPADKNKSNTPPRKSSLEPLNKDDELSQNLSSEKAPKKGKWSVHEDELLRKAVETYGATSWKLVARQVPERNSTQCFHRWNKVLRPGLAKGTWTAEEKQILLEWVAKNGSKRWSKCAENIPGRTGKQCREHWFNHLKKGTKVRKWTSEEDETLRKLFEQFGTQWTKMKPFLPGRTENSIKNRFYTTFRGHLTQDEANSKLHLLMLESGQLPLENKMNEIQMLKERSSNTLHEEEDLQNLQRKRVKKDEESNISNQNDQESVASFDYPGEKLDALVDLTKWMNTLDEIKNDIVVFARKTIFSANSRPLEVPSIHSESRNKENSDKSQIFLRPSSVLHQSLDTGASYNRRFNFKGDLLHQKNDEVWSNHITNTRVSVPIGTQTQHQLSYFQVPTNLHHNRDLA